ncbi:hypothetical protein SNOG_00454 [Parastagonospora nodorum SN15]|uniref:Uncharacterized protein n=1 Tax=Phaeosphaeria nodorum (strain SN15 / ATCC MYA-4574 / FGSC 10173) TaxID=321614 RepID=Q0V6B0_PHANO|nr:hypothetical protein SNOG_00454 [Parastagonospora nodorum SN15]EAT91949.1 hypothetical protein SNOG_00454 [Parastagonospora nodorum SN15]
MCFYVAPSSGPSHSTTPHHDADLWWYELHITKAPSTSTTINATCGPNQSQGLCSTWTNEARESRKVKEGGKLDGQENKWHVTPRDVDIHNRGTVRSGRLTVISEEEYNSCGDAVRRRRGNKSKSSESGRSKATSGGTKKVEQTLLECLVA